MKNQPEEGLNMSSRDKWILLIGTSIILALFISGSSSFEKVGSGILPLLTLCLGISAMVAVYFIPTLVAYKRGHKNSTAIKWLNILLGWTFIGWVISLVWALTKD